MKHQTAGKARFWFSIITSLILASAVLVFAFLKTTELNQNIALLSADLASTTKALAMFSQDLSALHTQTKGILSTLTTAQQDIVAAKSNISNVEQTVGSVSNKVSTLQKLATTDPEFLKKYSKVYFLNENYVPAHLTTIPQADIYSNTKQEQFLSETWPFLQNLLASTKANGITMYVKSAYRSFAEQKALKTEDRVVYGAGTANSFSADQGYSEHQIGTTVDFTAPGLGGTLDDSFDSTAAFGWLKQNAYKFGFILSYPKGNTYYIYEPWHWRFVSVKLATYLYDHGINFYDMDQRDIDTYLANFFD